MTVSPKVVAPDKRWRLSQLKTFSDSLLLLTDSLREQIIAPNPRKNPPTFTSGQVADLCGIDRARLNYLLTKDGANLPLGELQGSGRSRLFSVVDTRKWVQEVSLIPKSPLLSGEPGNAKILLTANFKGGSAKTSTCMCIAQGLSLRGRKVLVIDLDPQASLTELCGLYAERLINADDTVYPYIADPEAQELKWKIQDTYWDGLDVIPAHPSLFGAEFQIPSMVEHCQSNGYQFWSILRRGLEPLKPHYDYILIDTAPSLSYLTINALMATNGLIVPLIPDSLDFISSVSFWNLFSEMSEVYIRHDGDRVYDFVSVLLSKVDNSPTSAAPVVKSWARSAYGNWVSDIEIPMSSAVRSSALAVSTVFDIGKAEGSTKAFDRVVEPFRDYCRWIDDMYFKEGA